MFPSTVIFETTQNLYEHEMKYLNKEKKNEIDVDVEGMDENIDGMEDNVHWIIHQY